MAARKPAAANERPAGTTLGDKAGNIGGPLRDVADYWVTVEAMEFRSVNMTDKESGENVDRELCILTIDGGNKVHTWSPFLIEKLKAVDPSELPLPARFSQRDTSNGNRVWTVE